MKLAITHGKIYVEAHYFKEAYWNYSKNNQKIRVTHQIRFKDLEAFKKRIETGYVIQNDIFLWYDPLKLFADGTLGARTLDQVLRVFASLNDPLNTLRHGIIHLQITNDELLQRFKDLNLIAYIQPIFLHQDLHI